MAVSTTIPLGQTSYFGKTLTSELTMTGAGLKTFPKRIIKIK
jgi:hypothetical protein